MRFDRLAGSGVGEPFLLAFLGPFFTRGFRTTGFRTILLDPAARALTEREAALRLGSLSLGHPRQKGWQGLARDATCPS